MAKKALCMGINDYPGTKSDLSGCVNDANDWANTLETRGFSVTLMTDGDLKKAAMVQALENLISSADAGDSLIVTFAGHGSFVPDQSGDESDGQDEGICPHDIGEGNLLLDDEIHQLFKKRAIGSKIVLISDCCHSGSIIRMASPDADSDGPRIRFLPPSEWLKEEQLPRSPQGQPLNTIAAPRGVSSFWANALSFVAGDLLMSGCQDHEFSYDAKFQGRPNGAFTYYALKSLKRMDADATYKDWHKAIRKNLPGASYPQSPQIMGSKLARNYKILS